MASIIVFSKDRPMQLHAYLESLLFFSDVKLSDITILYYEANGISYDRVKSEFPNANWIPEENFQKDLLSILKSAQAFSMFGCDDVVFTAPFRLCDAEDALQSDSETFGFSFRLGKNILPCPSNCSSDKRYIKWQWRTNEAHYNYPWELDSTLYRTSDIQSLVAGDSVTISNPNYLESSIAQAPSKFIQRPNLMCYNRNSQSIVITVNRVQDTHPNPFDSAENCDVRSLSQLYNKAGNSMDIEAIAQKGNSKIHVGSDYFIMRSQLPATLKLVTYLRKKMHKFKRKSRRPIYKLKALF